MGISFDIIPLFGHYKFPHEEFSRFSLQGETGETII
jgi:hypothetical protein